MATVVERMKGQIEELRQSFVGVEEKRVVEQPKRPPEALKREYIEQLVNPISEGWSSDKLEFEEYLSQFPVADLQDLYLELRKLFTPECSNFHRMTIVRCFVKENKLGWPLLIKQVSFIIPHGSEGHDVMWAVESLTKVLSSQRPQLVNTANRLFTFETLTKERCYILADLAGCPEQWKEIDQYTETERNDLVAQIVPSNLRPGSRVCYVFDRVLNAGWKV